MKTLIGIIGHQGKYGRFLERLFTDYDCEVIGADARDGPDVDGRNRVVIDRAQVVVFSLPPREIIRGAISCLTASSRPEQLWLDITSIKVAPVQAMLQSQAEVVGLHPMCAPTVGSLRGQTVVVCPARLAKWERWLNEFLYWTGAKLKVCAPEEHDRAMAIVQGLVHAMQLTMAATIRSLGEDVSESLSFTSPVYKIAFSLIGRILKQDAELYADIQMLNPNTPQVLGQAVAELQKFLETVTAQDRTRFIEEFGRSRDHFGAKELDNAFQLFEELSQLLADRSSEYQVLLEVHEDRPGWLHAVTGIFAEAGINLIHIHSFQAAKGYRFLVGLDRPRQDSAVKLVLEKIAEQGLANEVHYK